MAAPSVAAAAGSLAGPSVGIVGSGISGAICARMLQRAGLAVTVFEKSRENGGRMAARARVQPFRFDHGAQYFSLERHPQLAQELLAARAIAPWPSKISWIKGNSRAPTSPTSASSSSSSSSPSSSSPHASQGALAQEHGHAQSHQSPFHASDAAASAPHPSPTAPCYVGTPVMSSVSKELLRGIDVHVHRLVNLISWDSEKKQWSIGMYGGYAPKLVDVLLFAMPAPQIKAILPASVSFSGDVARASYHPCWTVMFGFKDRVPVEGDVFNFHSHPVLARALRNSAKPARSHSTEAWVVQANVPWSESHLEEETNTVEKIIAQHFKLSIDDARPQHIAGHRWRYAFAKPLHTDSLWDNTAHVGACGDWCLGSSVQLALESGISLASKVLKDLGAKK